jgi:hypothetical protein
MRKLETFESFSMYRENCDRCGNPTGGTTTQSMFNEDVICMKCKDDERKDIEKYLSKKWGIKLTS